MKRLAKRLLQRLLARRNQLIVPAPHLRKLQDEAFLAAKARALGVVGDEHLRAALALLGESRSQVNQDFFALEANGCKRGGYFVEFGATDGESLSNSWLLEKYFGWNGILAEPARIWRERLAGADRTAARDHDCVWSTSGESLTFRESEFPELSTLESVNQRDGYDRQQGPTYQVTTVSLGDLLDRHGAPAEIDYLSIDTEGSELEILSAYNFASRPIRCISVEHNYSPDRERIHALLTGKGYRQMHKELSLHDDFYVLAR